MKQILILGGAGMLGHALARVRKERPDDPWEARLLDLDRCDIRIPEQVDRAVRESRPDVVILCAAYTNVDGAETDPATAFAVNADGAGVVARACRAAGARLVYVSTDYVFDGRKAAPYREDDPPAPLNVYGRSKWEGEKQVLAGGGPCLIARTSWLYGPCGKHFVRAILERASRGEELRVVGDQVGAPTYTIDLARALYRLVEIGAQGILNVTNAGSCSWLEFARTIVRHAGIKIAVREITSAELNRPAIRPANSRLDGGRLAALGVAMPDWEDALQRYLALGEP